jgi:hypothetical protein
MNYRNIIEKLFFNKDNKLNKSNYYKLIRNENKYKNIKNYINKLYNDSESIKESLYRLLHNISVRPVCLECGNKVKFVSKNNILYTTYCSTKCKYKNDSKKIKITKKLRYSDCKYNNVIKAKQTKLERYGNENYNNVEKNKQTCLNKYGVDNIRKSNEYKSYIKSILSEINNKKYLTHRRNNSFNISKSETKTYNLLKEKYPDIIRNYKSKLYPFNCDFYIPSLDLYIECNYHWTHGGHQYNENNLEDKNKVTEWKNKNTKYYNNAIETWTIRDINKMNIAKENKLNYMIFWNIDDIINLLIK